MSSESMESMQACWSRRFNSPIAETAVTVHALSNSTIECLEKVHDHDLGGTSCYRWRVSCDCILRRALDLEHKPCFFMGFSPEGNSTFSSFPFLRTGSPSISSFLVSLQLSALDPHTVVEEMTLSFSNPFPAFCLNTCREAFLLCSETVSKWPPKDNQLYNDLNYWSLLSKRHARKWFEKGVSSAVEPSESQMLFDVYLFFRNPQLIQNMSSDLSSAKFQRSHRSPDHLVGFHFPVTRNCGSVLTYFGIFELRSSLIVSLFPALKHCLLLSQKTH